MSDRIHMAGESIEMAAYIYAKVLGEYARINDYELADCVIVTDPNDKFRMICGEVIEIHCYSNIHNHEAYAAVQYSQMDGSIDIEFR